MKSRTKEKKKKRRKGIYITLVSLVVLLIGGYLFRQQLAVAAFDLFLAGSVEGQLSKSYVPQEGNKTPDPTVYRKEPFSVLLLGSDKRAYEKTRGRSDTVIYAVVRPKESRVLLVSIPVILMYRLLDVMPTRMAWMITTSLLMPTLSEGEYVHQYGGEVSGCGCRLLCNDQF